MDLTHSHFYFCFISHSHRFPAEIRRLNQFCSSFSTNACFFSPTTSLREMNNRSSQGETEISIDLFLNSSIQFNYQMNSFVSSTWMENFRNSKTWFRHQLGLKDRLIHFWSQRSPHSHALWAWIFAPHQTGPARHHLTLCRTCMPSHFPAVQPRLQVSRVLTRFTIVHLSWIFKRLGLHKFH